MRDQNLVNKERLIHTWEAISANERFVSDVDEKEFLSNELIHSSVLMKFIIIGEAIIHVDQSLLSRYDYSWFKVRAFTNFIENEYFTLQLSSE
jgi:uncharacterized protein with HEPN domain